MVRKCVQIQSVWCMGCTGSDKLQAAPCTKYRTTYKQHWTCTCTSYMSYMHDNQLHLVMASLLGEKSWSSNPDLFPKVIVAAKGPLLCGLFRRLCDKKLKTAETVLLQLDPI